MPDFMFNALIAGTITAITAGPLGCLVVWKRMSYFGAAIAHCALLGVALAFLAGGLLLNIADSTHSVTYKIGQSLINEPWPVMLVLSLMVAISLLYLQNQVKLPNDTLLGIVAHGALAIGFLVIGTIQSLRIDIMSYLSGDILGIDSTELWLHLIISTSIILTLWYWWKNLLSSTAYPDLASVEGINVKQTELVFVLLLALVIALGIQVAGLLLIISMLIIPPATARGLVKSAPQMAIVSSLIGVLNVWLGLAIAWHLDLPASPAIVGVSILAFILVTTLPKKVFN